VFLSHYLKAVRPQTKIFKEFARDCLYALAGNTSACSGVLFLIPVMQHNGFPIPFRMGIGYVLLMLYSSARGVTSNNSVAHGNGQFMTSSDDVKC
jgi:hypothetical protein